MATKSALQQVTEKSTLHTEDLMYRAARKESAAFNPSAIFHRTREKSQNSYRSTNDPKEQSYAESSVQGTARPELKFNCRVTGKPAQHWHRLADQ